MMSLPDLTRHTLRQHHLLPAGSRLVVGVSGGTDSLALLHILHALGIELHAATFDHGLRGSAGADDVRFVVATCQSWNIPITAGAASVEVRGEGVEQAARTARYDFLAQVAHRVGAKHVAVAHHAGDQAETVLLHLVRGAGLGGLAGMTPSAPLPSHPDLTLIRPLLPATRAAIEAYCEEHNLHPRQDATNEDTTLLRNRLRLETLPYLRRLNPRIDHALAQLAMISAADFDFIRGELENRIEDALTLEARRVTLARSTFQQLPAALQNHFILYAVEKLGGKDTGFEHVLAAVDLAQRGHTGQIATLPRNLRLRLDYDAIVIEEADTPPTHDGPLLPEGIMLEVAVPGDTPLPDGQWALQTRREPFVGDVPQARLVIGEGQQLCLRTRRAGDRFRPQGLGGHRQKLKKWMIDHKIPQAIRDQIPIITVDGEIAAFMIGDRWIIGELGAHTNRKQAILYASLTRYDQS